MAGGYASWASSDATRKSMRGNRSVDTKPELLVRRALHARGLRFRKHVRPEADLRCVADIVFPRHRVAVFVDGCFWHGCPAHSRIPASNQTYWTEKLGGNVRRDKANSAKLVDAGWTVLRFWEHEPIDHVAESIARSVQTWG